VKGVGVNYLNAVKHTETIMYVLQGHIGVLSGMVFLTFVSNTDLLHVIYPAGKHNVLNPLRCNLLSNLVCDISCSVSHQNSFILHLHDTVTRVFRLSATDIDLLI
jgi:hypothetical protein